MNEKIIIYGAGERGKRLIEILDFCNVPIAVVIDSNSEKWGNYIDDYRIESPDILLQMIDYKLCISIANDDVKEEIREMLIGKYGFNEVNEMTYMDLILYAYDTVNINKFGIEPIELTHIRNWSVIFDCEYGLVLGGIEEWSKGICTEFINRGEMDSYILSNYSNYEVPEFLKNNIIRANVNPENAFLPSNIGELVRCLVNYLPCTLVTSQPNEVLIVGKILKRYFGRNIQIVSGIRGGSETIYNNYIQMKKCTDLYVCVSSDITRNMVMRGITEDRALTMICPISCPSELKRKYTINRDEPIRIGYAGRIVVEQKRMDLMIKLIDILEKRNINYYMEFAGAGDYELCIRDYIIRNNCESRIKFVGHLNKEEIEKFWSDKDICLNLADYEGRSRSIAEAMANGVVPIVTETSGVHDDINNETNGYIVPIGDYVKMANCIVDLELDRELLAIMGKKAHLEIKNKSNMQNHYLFWKKIISDWKNTI